MQFPIKKAITTFTLLLLTTSAHAGLMKAELTGTTVGSFDSLGLFTSGGATNFDGRTATLTFFYEVSDAPTDANGAAETADYSSFDDWINATITVSGPTTTIDEEDWGLATDDLTDADGIYFNDTPGAYEYNIFSNDVDFDGLDYDNALFFAEVIDTNGDWLLALSPDSEFIWDNTELTGNGIGYFYLETQFGNADASIIFNYLTVTAVPAPTGLVLLLLGLCALGKRRLFN